MDANCASFDLNLEVTVESRQRIIIHSILGGCFHVNFRLEIDEHFASWYDNFIQCEYSDTSETDEWN